MWGGRKLQRERRYDARDGLSRLLGWPTCINWEQWGLVYATIDRYKLPSFILQLPADYMYISSPASVSDLVSVLRIAGHIPVPVDFLDRVTLFLISGNWQSRAIFLSPSRPPPTTRFLLVVRCHRLLVRVGLCLLFYLRYSDEIAYARCLHQVLSFSILLSVCPIIFERV